MNMQNTSQPAETPPSQSGKGSDTKQLLAGKSARTIKKNLRELRELIDESDDDPILQRIAYEMETAVRWATENTVGWPGLAQQARDAAHMLKSEIAS